MEKESYAVFYVLKMKKKKKNLSRNHNSFKIRSKSRLWNWDVFGKINFLQDKE